MVWKIGRALLSDRHGREEGPGSITQSGDLLQLAGLQMPSSLYQGRLLRQTILGLAASGEIVPILAPTELDLTGFYQITGGQVSAMPSTDTHGQFEWAVAAQKVPEGWTRATHEVIYDVSLRANTESVVAVNAEQTLAWPHSADGTGINPIANIVATDSGNIKRYRAAITPPSTKTEALHSVAPVDYYNGAATIEILDSTNQWWPITGTQPPELRGVRLSNGLVRVTVGGVTPTITVERFSAGSWTAPIIVRFDGAGEAVPVPATVKISRNSVEAVAVTFTAEDGSQQIPFTLGLARGMFHAEMGFAAGFVAIINLVIAGSTWSQVAAIYGDCARSTTFAGWSVVVAAANATIAGSIFQPSIINGTVTWTLGVAIPANAGIEVCAAYFAAQSETQRVVA
jgi:hypothetical protein